jgi:hypothetical protein
MTRSRAFVHQSMRVEDLRQAISDEALERGAESLLLPSTWATLPDDDPIKHAARSRAWHVLKAVLCDG